MDKLRVQCTGSSDQSKSRARSPAGGIGVARLMYRCIATRTNLLDVAGEGEYVAADAQVPHPRVRVQPHCARQRAVHMKRH
eukprot:1197588-Pyramimonas_sp.AAC.1